ncbi:MAG: hypothetical protein AVDCRST_MAG53-2050, partial [uncultured Solirubrobacteraceae bacterium]
GRPLSHRRARRQSRRAARSHRSRAPWASLPRPAGGRRRPAPDRADGGGRGPGEHRPGDPERRGAALGHGGVAPARRARVHRRRVDRLRRRALPQRHLREQHADLRSPAPARRRHAAGGAHDDRLSPPGDRGLAADADRRRDGPAPRPHADPAFGARGARAALQGRRVRDSGPQPGHRRRAAPQRRRRQGAPALALRPLQDRAPAAEPEALAARGRDLAIRVGDGARAV